MFICLHTQTHVHTYYADIHIHIHTRTLDSIHIHTNKHTIQTQHPQGFQFNRSTRGFAANGEAFGTRKRALELTQNPDKPDSDGVKHSRSNTSTACTPMHSGRTGMGSSNQTQISNHTASSNQTEIRNRTEIYDVDESRYVDGQNDDADVESECEEILP